MAQMLSCPYCYEKFTERQILFRCTSRLSPANRRCELELDKTLEDRTGVARQLGPVFQADGRKASAVHEVCRDTTTNRVCPVCHSRLPVQFGMVSSRMIAMVGARASGKTVYMTVLLHELRHRVGERFGAAIMGADDETRKRFVDTYEEPLYEGALPAPTSRAAAQQSGLVAPLVFRFSAATGGRRPNRAGHTLLSFFDTAGEDFNERESLEVNTRYLRTADGILLLLDPTQMPGARTSVTAGFAHSADQGPRPESPVNILSRVTEILLAGQRGTGKISKPIAAVFTKLDAVWHSLEQASPLRDHPPEGPQFDVTDCLNVHEEIRDLLREWDGGEISAILDTHYSRFRFFGVSALGHPPTAANKVAPTGIQPYRIADPLLWMLSEFGAIPRTGKG
jgi:GTPase SAR1 family protein